MGSNPTLSASVKAFFQYPPFPDLFLRLTCPIYLPFPISIWIQNEVGMKRKLHHTIHIR